MLKVEVLEAIRNPHQVRILLLLNDKKVMRFNQIQDTLRLNPAQVSRALKRLYLGRWILLKTIPGGPAGNSIPVEYEISGRGEKLAKEFRQFVHHLRTGPSAIREAGLGDLVAEHG